MMKDFIQLINNSMKDQSLFYLSQEELRKQQNPLIKACFQYHYNNCEYYHKFCRGRGIDPKNINGIEDHSKIPLLDSFKTLRKRQFLSVPKKEIISQFCSTGSSGKPLLWISLDQTTTDWMIRASTLFNKTMIEIKPGATLLMVPYIPQLKFAVVSKAILSKMNQQVYFGLRAIFGKDPLPKIELDMKSIELFVKNPASVKNLMGFPFTITLLKDHIETHDLQLSLGEDGIIVTGGGWKPRQKNSNYANMSRTEIERIISDPFNIPVENIRDAYGCTEILLGFIECKHKRYHVPPWCYQIAVDPNDLENIGEDTKGLGACYDFAVHSYPGFILTEDFIKVYNDPCPCGISGQTIEYIGRIQDEDPRGCSFKFEDKLFSEVYLAESPTIPSSKSTDGLLQYMVQNKLSITGDFIMDHTDLIRKAMDTIIETITVKEIKLSLAEEVKTLQFVALGKLMCYKHGKPTLLREEELMEQMSELKPEIIKKILNLFMKRGFVKKVEKAGQLFYRFTKKADEFGEAFYPLLIWAIKYTN
ncbi:MAG: hypothetical protein ACFFD2_12640 [Promethearchaeota archaeon]